MEATACLSDIFKFVVLLIFKTFLPKANAPDDTIKTSFD